MAAKEHDYLALDDDALLGECEIHYYKSSGPGGQHRNKVSSAVRLKHVPTGISAHGDDSRTQHENKRLAVTRLRMNIACGLRRKIDPADIQVPPVVAECIFTPKNRTAEGPMRLQIGRKDFRFWRVAAFLLDLLEARAGGLADAAAVLGITTSNMVSVLKDDRHLLAAAQAIRKAHGQGPIK